MLTLGDFRTTYTLDLRRLVQVTAASGGRAGTDAGRTHVVSFGAALYLPAHGPPAISLGVTVAATV